jgi:hypothetical protein
MKTSTYNKVLIISFICISLPLSFFVFWLEPYSGDLARIGGFKENEYGWNSFQKRFKKCHYTLGSNIEDYNKYFDIVTIGDSFSVNEAQSWQNYLALSSNASIITFHSASVSATSILKHPQFIESPPKLFIFQAVEHGIQTVLHDIDLDLAQENNVIKPPKAQLNYKSFKFDNYLESYSRQRVTGFSMNTALHYIKTNIKQGLGGRKKSLPIKVEDKERLFSNNHPDSALFYHLDKLKLSINKNEWGIIEKRFSILQNLIQANGFTNFIAMIAPDKSTVYRSYLLNPEARFESSLNLMPNKNSVNWLNIEQFMVNSIEKGTIDLYLPNDTHWGCEGYKVAAEAIIKH